jgi:hypothetical protein
MAGCREVVCLAAAGHRLWRPSPDGSTGPASQTHLLGDLGASGVGRMQRLLAARGHDGVGLRGGAAAKAEAGEEGEHGAGGGRRRLRVALLQERGAAVCRAGCMVVGQEGMGRSRPQNQMRALPAGLGPTAMHARRCTRGDAAGGAQAAHLAGGPAPGRWRRALSRRWGRRRAARGAAPLPGGAAAARRRRARWRRWRLRWPPAGLGAPRGRPAGGSQWAAASEVADSARRDMQGSCRRRWSDS